MMKKAISVLLFFACLLILASCNTPTDLYGTWYNDYNGTRNAIQFSENENGEDVFIWAVYDIENDAVETNNSGKFKISGNSIKFEFEQGIEPMKLQYSFENGVLVLTSDTAVLKLERYTLDN